MYAFLIMGDAERLVQSEFTDAVFFIELGQGSLHLFSCSVCAKLLRQLTDPGADPFIIDLALLHAAGIIFY